MIQYDKMQSWEAINVYHLQRYVYKGMDKQFNTHDMIGYDHTSISEQQDMGQYSYSTYNSECDYLSVYSSQCK